MPIDPVVRITAAILFWTAILLVIWLAATGQFHGHTHNPVPQPW